MLLHPVSTTNLYEGQHNKVFFPMLLSPLLHTWTYSPPIPTNISTHLQSFPPNALHRAYPHHPSCTGSSFVSPSSTPTCCNTPPTTKIMQKVIFNSAQYLFYHMAFSLSSSFLSSCVHIDIERSIYKIIHDECNKNQALLSRQIEPTCQLPYSVYLVAIHQIMSREEIIFVRIWLVEADFRGEIFFSSRFLLLFLFTLISHCNSLVRMHSYLHTHIDP